MTLIDCYDSHANQLTTHLKKKVVEEEYHKRGLYYTPSEKQLKFHNANKENIEVLFCGANRSGKTHSGKMDNFFDATGFYPNWYDGHKFTFPPTIMIIVPTAKDIREIFQRDYFEGIAGRPPIFHPSLVLKKKTNNSIVDYAEIKHISGGTTLMLFYSNEQKWNKFQGKRIHKIHFDEEPDAEVYKEALIRIMDCDGMGTGRLNLTMTPLRGGTEIVMSYLRSTKHYINEAGLECVEEFLVPPEVSYNKKFYMHVSWDEAPNLEEETKKYMLAHMSKHEIEVRTKGLVLIGSGLVYQIPEDVYIADEIKLEDSWARFAGMDFGWQDDTAVVFMAHDRERDILYLYDEYKINKQTPDVHANILYNKGLNWIPTICDPSGSQTEKIVGESLMDKYKEYGLKLIPGKQAKETNIYEIMHRMSTGRLKISKDCRNVLMEMCRYSRDKNGKIMKGNDHLMNALEYCIIRGCNYATTKMEYMLSYQYKSADVGLI